MFKISRVDTPNQLRLVLEGKLIAPWADELKATCERALAQLNGRELVVDLKCLTTISQQGENLLVELMELGVKCRGRDLFTKQFLKHLAQRLRSNGANR